MHAYACMHMRACMHTCSTEFEPHWDFLEGYKRGWFPRNVSDVAGLEKLNVCDPSTPPLKPTTWYIASAGGIYEGKTVHAGWLAWHPHACVHWAHVPPAYPKHLRTCTCCARVPAALGGLTMGTTR